MKQALRRPIPSLATGFILFYYAELMFWATPDREGMSVPQLIITWLVYSIFAYAFLSVVSIFRVRNVWAVFLAGAVYGWLDEGIFVQTTYGSPDTPFPMSISFTGLAWHALINVLVGWYLVRRIMARNRLRQTIALAGAIGCFYGLWAVFWWTEPAEPMKALFDDGRGDLVLLHFSVFAMLTTAFLVLAHWVYDRVAPGALKPSKAGVAVLSVIVLLWYWLVAVPAAPRAIWLLPLLLGPTFWGLEQNRRREKARGTPDPGPESTPMPTAANYLCMFFIPITAIAIYAAALAANAALRTNMVVYYVSSYAGIVMWGASIALAARGPGQGRGGVASSAAAPGDA